MGQSLPIGFAWRRATKARDDLLPFSFIARPEADSWRFISRFHKARAAAADGASHMLDYIFRPTIPAVQCEPAPKKGAVHNPAMTTKGARSEEHTSELQSLMRISYAVFCLKKKNTKRNKCNDYARIY